MEDEFMNVTLYDETDLLESGTYEAQLIAVFEYAKGEVCLKFQLSSMHHTIFLKFVTLADLGKHPWSHIFRAINTTDTDDLLNHTFRLEISTVTSKRSGTRFSNVKRIELLK